MADPPKIYVIAPPGPDKQRRVKYYHHALVDRLAVALRACKVRVPVDMDPPFEDGNLEAYREANAALAAYEETRDEGS